MVLDMHNCRYNMVYRNPINGRKYKDTNNPLRKKKVNQFELDIWILEGCEDE